MQPVAAPLAGLDGCVRHGVASWTDPTFVAKFYPPKTGAEDRLRNYATRLPCVEVDASTYTIPTVNRMQQWMKQVPKGFVFHLKVHQLFTHMRTEYSKLPKLIRDDFPHPDGPNAVEIALKDVPVAIQEQLFFLLVMTLEEAANADKMGFLVCQFPEDFSFSDESKAWITKLRKWLPARIRMAIEFRSRSWYTDAGSRTPNDPMTTENGSARLSQTLDFCRSLPATMISVDEYLQRDAIPSAAKQYPARVVPVLVQPTSDQFFIRVHRRVGEHRVLNDVEIQEWADRLHKMLRDSNGAVNRVWIIWNTNHELQPIQNAERLTAKLQPGLVLNWKAQYLETQKTNKGSMFAFLKAPAKKGAPQPAAEPDEADEGAEASKKREHEEDDEEPPTPSLSAEDEPSTSQASQRKPSAVAAASAPAAAPKKHKADAAPPAAGNISKFFSPTKKK